MKQATVLKSLIFVAILVVAALVMRCIEGGEGQASSNLKPLYSQMPLRQQSGPDNDSGHLSGTNPTPKSTEPSREIEREILASTVRMEVELWTKRPIGPAESGLYEYSRAKGNGYGTIRDGRYLVTHNHYDILLPTLDHPIVFDYSSVRLFRANGERLAVMDLNNAFVVAEEQLETLVLDFGTVAGEGFFTTMGLPSANFASWEELALQPGITVAQLDWDGKSARVKWVMVTDVVTEQGTPRLEFTTSLMPGASGGGVFWEGYHVANNWRVIEHYDSNGRLAYLQTMAALN